MAYDLYPFPPEREIVVDAGYLGTGRHIIYALVELDVTRARELLRLPPRRRAARFPLRPSSPPALPGRSSLMPGSRPTAIGAAGWSSFMTLMWSPWSSLNPGRSPSRASSAPPIARPCLRSAMRFASFQGQPDVKTRAAGLRHSRRTRRASCGWASSGCSDGIRTGSSACRDRDCHVGGDVRPRRRVGPGLSPPAHPRRPRRRHRGQAGRSLGARS